MEKELIMTEQNPEGQSGDRQDPAEQYRTDQQVDTAAQPDPEPSNTTRVNGTDYTVTDDRGYRETPQNLPQQTEPAPVEVSPEEPVQSTGAPEQVSAPESGDVSEGTSDSSDSSSDAGAGADSSSS